MTTTAADHLAEWWSRAACKSADPELFFPISHSGPAGAQIMRAKAICAGCAVQDECLRYALAADPVHGVWGGMSEEERRLLRRREQKARTRAARRSSFSARSCAGRSVPAGARASASRRTAAQSLPRFFAARMIWVTR
jgi:WhiB family transcriptional regulator, redox-sensing transcriptional regulator